MYRNWATQIYFRPLKICCRPILKSHVIECSVESIMRNNFRSIICIYSQTVWWRFLLSCWNKHSVYSDAWREIFMKQSVNKCRLLKLTSEIFVNLCFLIFQLLLVQIWEIALISEMNVGSDFLFFFFKTCTWCKWLCTYAKISPGSPLPPFNLTPAPHPPAPNTPSPLQQSFHMFTLSDMPPPFTPTPKPQIPPLPYNKGHVKCWYIIRMTFSSYKLTAQFHWSGDQA